MFMKKAVVFVLVLLGILPFLLCCGKQEVTNLYLGINAEIMEIDFQNRTLKVCLSDNKKLIFTVDCSHAADKHQLLYADYETEMTQDIPFESLEVGDAIALCMEKETYQQLKWGDKVQALSVQLLTQRFRVEPEEIEGERLVKVGDTFQLSPSNP